MALTGLTNLQPLHVHSIGISTFDGSVSVGGTLTYEDVTNIDSVGIVTARTGIKVLAGGINVVGVVTATSFVGSGANLTGISQVGGSTGVDFNDNVKIRLGTGNDLEIFHDGNDSYIGEVGTGSLKVLSNLFRVNNAANSESMIQAHENGQVELYHNNVKKLETTSGGAKILNGTGDAQLDIRGGSSDGRATLQFTSDDNNANNDNFRLRNDANNDFYIQNYSSGSWETNIKAVGDGAVELYNDNEIVFKTSSSQVQARRRIQIHADAPGSGHGMSIGQWDGSNHRLEGDSNRPMMITSYNSTGIKMGVSGANKVAVNSHGIVFNGDTAAANALDDYEEGTFTPQWNGGSGGVSSITYGNTNGGNYVKIGNLVTVTGKTDITGSTGGSGFWYLGNMPFLVYGGGKQYNSVGAVSIENFNMPATTIQVVATMEQNNNNMHLHDVRDNQALGTGISINNDGAFSVQFSITYRTT